MERMHVTVDIKASPEKVWKTMLDEKSYREWTKAFDPSSRYVGKWEAGTKMLFLGSDPATNQDVGMVSMIREVRPHQFLSMEHIGIIKGGVEDLDSPEARKWTPAFENYTFTEKDGGTELAIDLDVSKEEKQNMEAMWKSALERLKALAEK